MFYSNSLISFFFFLKKKDYRPGPTIQLGINTLREMAMRCPLALDEETVKMVSQFKGYDKDKVFFYFFVFLFFVFFSHF